MSTDESPAPQNPKQPVLPHSLMGCFLGVVWREDGVRGTPLPAGAESRCAAWSMYLQGSIAFLDRTRIQGLAKLGLEPISPVCGEGQLDPRDPTLSPPLRLAFSQRLAVLHCQCPLCWALGDLFSLSHVADPFRQVRSEDWGKQKRNLRERQRVRRIGLPRRDLGIFSCLPPELRACLSAVPAAVTQGTPNWSQAAEGLGVLSACRTHLIGAGACVESCSSATPTLESGSPLQTAPLRPRGLSRLLLLRGRGGCARSPFHVPPEAGKPESGEPPTAVGAKAGVSSSTRVVTWTPGV